MRSADSSRSVYKKTAADQPSEQNGRQQQKNLDEAYKEMTKRVNEFYQIGHLKEESTQRKGQVGIGNRSDKRRTYRVKDGIVIDHITGKQTKLKNILRGKIDLLSN